MKKSDLEREAHITHYALSKLSQGKDVSTEVLGKICDTLDCSVDDIMEFIVEKQFFLILFLDNDGNNIFYATKARK